MEREDLVYVYCNTLKSSKIAQNLSQEIALQERRSKFGYRQEAKNSQN